MEMYRLQRNFYHAIAFENIDLAKKTVAEWKNDIANLDSKIKSTVDESLWPLKYQNKTLNWRLEFYAEREKRRSENRREKRLRKKQRKAAAKSKGLNRMDVDANGAGEE